MQRDVHAVIAAGLSCWIALLASNDPKPSNVLAVIAASCIHLHACLPASAAGQTAHLISKLPTHLGCRAGCQLSLHEALRTCMLGSAADWMAPSTARTTQNGS